MPITLNYRIGTSDRAIGSPTGAADGFSVLNQTSGHVFVAQAGLWTDGGTFPFPTSPFDFPALLAVWFATNTTNLSTDGMMPSLLADSSGNVTGGLGYRIGTSDRTIGDAAAAPDGFYVLNTTNNNAFVAIGGLWADGGVFPTDLMAAWLS